MSKSKKKPQRKAPSPAEAAATVAPASAAVTTTETPSPVSSSKAAARPQPARDWLERLDTRLLFALVFAVALLISLSSRFWDSPSGSDRANWDYFAQVIARGGVPYKDVVNIKSPLSAYIGAAAILVTKPFGLDDVLAIRFAFVLLAALTVAFCFLVALAYFQNRRLALLAAAFMIAIDTFWSLSTAGIQPKTPMILFGLAALWASVKDRPFLAGVCGMLSALCWQPGLLFVGVAGLAFSKYLTNWRDGRVIRLLAGAALPLALFAAYLLLVGALKEFYLWNVHFNATIYAEHEARTPENFFAKIAKLLRGFYGNSRPYFYVALVGLVALATREIRRGIQQGRGYWLEAAPLHGVIIAPVVYFVFCMVNMQSAPDLIPLLPFVAILAAFLFVSVVEGLAAFLWRKPSTSGPPAWVNWACATLALLLCLRGVMATPFERYTTTLKDQRVAVAQAVSSLQPGDSLFVYGRTEVLVLSGRANADKHFLLDKGKDIYLDQVEEGGFRGWLERLKARRPKVVVYDRLASTPYLNLLVEWVAAEYEPRIVGDLTYFVRKDALK